MAVEALDRLEAARRCVRQFGLDSETVDLDSPEALAASLRRAASFLCPVGPARLVRTVETATLSLTDGDDDLRERLLSLLEAMIGHGDLVELPGRDQTAVPQKQLYLGLPAFVRRASGSYLVLGIRPEAATLVGEELLPLVEYDRHVRSVRANPERDIDDLLLASGLRELPAQTWLQSPRTVDPQSAIDDFDARLAVAGPSGEIEGLRVIDAATPVRYYRGRWRPPSADDFGRFVARRPQAFGADLWCYAELDAGRVVRLVDLPVDPSLSRGCDEAWRLQAAIDAARGQPQVVRVQGTAGVIDLFSPIPRWLQRRWDSVGKPTRSPGALLSYSFALEEVVEEVEFAASMLWLSRVPADAVSSTDAN